MQPLLLHKLRNLLHSAILVLGMAAIAAGCAWTLWGLEGLAWTLIAVVLALAVSPSLPPELILTLYRARPLGRAQLPEAHAILDWLSRKARLPVLPRLYYVPSSVVNAFTLGSASAPTIAVTDGALRVLTLRELAGVLAHEVSHIANNDLWIMSLADVISRVTTILSILGLALLLVSLPLLATGAVAVPWLLVALLVCAPTLINLLQLALSRTREFDADLDAARLLGDPAALASALVKIERQEARRWENLFWPGGRVPEPSLLRSHPRTQERVRRLLDLCGPQRPPARSRSDDRLLALPVAFHVIRMPPRWRWPGVWY